MVIQKFYKSPGLLTGELSNKLQAIKQICRTVDNLQTEICYYIESSTKLTAEDLEKVHFCFKSSFETQLRDVSEFEITKNNIIVEIGPRLNFSTAFSSNAVSIFKFTGLKNVIRVEKATRYLIKLRDNIEKNVEDAIVAILHDKMTECRYFKPIETFDHGFRPENWFEVDVLKYGRQALVDVDKKLGENLIFYFSLLRNICFIISILFRTRF